MHHNAEMTRVGKAVHWLVALTILGLISLGLYMAQGEHFHLYHLHKSIGLLALFAILGRLWYRLRRGWPKPVGNYPRHERLMAKASHWWLLAGILLMPLAGMLYSGAGGHGFGVFSLPLFPENHGPDGVEPFHAGLSAFGKQAHGLLGYILLGVIVLHVLGALKHHFIDRDQTLRRMLPLPNSNQRKDSRPINTENRGKAQ